jgi:hypothetical protein
MKSEHPDCVHNFRGIVEAVPRLMRMHHHNQPFQESIMKHRNIRNKANRVALKHKHERRQPPHRRQVGISIRKTIKAFIYDVFEDGYLIGNIRRD